MIEKISLEEARKHLFKNICPVTTEEITLNNCVGRILAQDIFAKENIPPFDRSPYDGYAFRAEDTQNASQSHPIVLQVLETILAGDMPTKHVSSGTATKIMTGSPIPSGADAVIMFEKTLETSKTITIFSKETAGCNIIRAGEDIRSGTIIARNGMNIDIGIVASLAAQGISNIKVYRNVRVGIISTGNEILDLGQQLRPGKIRNTNRYMLEAAIQQAGFQTEYIGTAGDSVSEIKELLEKGLHNLDAVILTGGVSAGDFDLTPDSMAAVGAEILFHRVSIKPGMACAYGICRGKPICALSGNPASALTNFYVLTLPMLCKLSGRNEFSPKHFAVRLIRDYKKKSPEMRLIRGKLVFLNGEAWMDFPSEQGNVVISSAIGCNMMAIIPAGSGPQSAGTMLEGFLLYRGSL